MNDFKYLILICTMHSCNTLFAMGALKHKQEAVAKAQPESTKEKLPEKKEKEIKVWSLNDAQARLNTLQDIAINDIRHDAHTNQSYYIIKYGPSLTVSANYYLNMLDELLELKQNDPVLFNQYIDPANVIKYTLKEEIYNKIDLFRIFEI